MHPLFAILAKLGSVLMQKHLLRGLIHIVGLCLFKDECLVGLFLVDARRLFLVELLLSIRHLLELVIERQRSTGQVRLELRKACLWRHTTYTLHHECCSFHLSSCRLSHDNQ